MIYALRGKIGARGEGFFTVWCGGMAFKIFSNKRTLALIPYKNKETEVFCYLYFREDRLELYGFLDSKTRDLFEMLNMVSGVGPRTALGVLDAGSAERVAAAIHEGKVDFISKVSGIGKKTAERVVLDLRNKIVAPKATKLGKVMKIDNDIEEVLVGLGYQRRKAREAVNNLGVAPEKFEERLKKALKVISH